jgi:hypothetical protein
MPVLVDEDIVVVNSADIIAYLDYRYPAKCDCCTAYVRFCICPLLAQSGHLDLRPAIHAT